MAPSPTPMPARPALGTQLRRRYGLAAGVATALLGAMAWLALSSAGSLWLLSWVPGLQVQGLHGNLWAAQWQIEQLSWQRGGTRVQVRGLHLGGFGGWFGQPWAWSLWRAEQVQVHTTPSASTPQPPASLRLPVGLSVARLELASLQVDKQPAVQQLSARLDLGLEGGAQHRVTALALHWDKLRAQGQLQLAADAPFKLQADARMASVRGTPWKAEAKVEGELAALELQTQLAGESEGERAAPSATLTARLAPFAAWPLQALGASTTALDLQALRSGWPHTRLSGQAELRSSGAALPAQAMVQLDNHEPGPWNTGRLPLYRARLQAQASLAEPQRLQLQQFEWQLSDKAAGRITGQALWLGHGASVQAKLEQLDLRLLDQRAPAAVLEGPMQLELKHLPVAPDGQAEPSGQGLVAELQARWSGRHAALAAPVQLDVSGTFEPRRWQLHKLALTAGHTRARLQALASRPAQGPLSLATEGELAEFDPAQWLPLPEAWRQGRHRLNGRWQAKLSAPENWTPTAWQALQGQAELNLHDSSLAGVALQAQASASRQGSALQAQAAINLGGNLLQLSAGAGEPVRLQWQAAQLASLAPLANLLPQAAPWWPRSGQTEGELVAHGPWPPTAVQARLSASGIQTPAHRLARLTAELQWQGGAANPALEGRMAPGFKLQAQADDLASAGLLIKQVQIKTEGQPGAHQFEASLELPGQLPAAMQQLLNLPVARSHTSQWQLAGNGQWQAETTGMRWQGQVQHLRGGAPGQAPWLEVAPVGLAMQLSPQGSLQRVQAGAGSAALGRQFKLRWEDIVYEPAGRGSYLLQAELEPFAAAPLLQRLQPELGWSGNLELGASVAIKAGERFDADVVLERRSGDLAIKDGTTQQALGLSELRLSVAAHEGTWYFTQSFAGAQLGEAAGAISLSTTPQHRWPQPQTPITGVLQARVAQLGVWGSWVPPGWRLSGSLATSASLGGSFGTPQFTGELRGSGLGARNLLAGVDVHSGEVAVRLSGARASIEQFSARAGEGNLQLSGEAELGAAPSANLQLKAHKFQLLGRIDRRAVASGEATLALQQRSARLNGRFTVDEGLFDFSRGNAPTLDDDVHVVIHGPARPLAAPEPAANPSMQAQLNLEVDMGQNLRLRGKGLDTALRGKLTLNNPGGALAVHGRVNAEDGSFAAYGQKMSIQRGELRFNGPAGNPTLNILALRPNLDVQAGVAVTGTAQAPRVRLYSEPDMSETDKLSWLVLGRAPDGLGRADTALLQRAAMALLAGDGQAPTDALIQRLGLDEFSVRQSEGEVRDTVVSLGKQLGRRWYVGYERSVNATAGTWQLIYRVAQRFTLRAQSGQENSLDLIWTRRFD